jgi:hypothetical protein
MNNYRQNHNNENIRGYDENEVSLVEIAKVIIRRWKWAVLIFIFSMVSGIGIIFFYNSGIIVPTEYVSIYQVANKSMYLKNKNSSSKTSLIPLKATEEKLNLYYKEKIIENYTKDKKVSALPFEITISVSEPSGFVIIKSYAVAADQEKIIMIKDVHKKLIDTLLIEDAGFFDYTKTAMVRKLKQAKKTYELVKNHSTYDAVRRSTNYLEEIADLENGLSGLASGQILKIGSEKKLSDPENKTNLILVLIGFSSFFLALITPFFVEFGANLRQSLKEDKEKK